MVIEQLTRAIDRLDHALRSAVPEVADVYLDVTSYRAATMPIDGESVGDNGSAGSRSASSNQDAQ